MYTNNYQRGVTAPVIVALIAAVAVVAGIAYYNMQPKEEIMIDKGEAMMEEGEDMMKEGEAMLKEGEEMVKEAEVMMEEKGDTMMHDEGAMKEEGEMMMEDPSASTQGVDAMFMGTLLAGTDNTPLLEFNEDDYQKALAEGKLVTLFFYANWCPICKEEFPKMQAAFDQLTVDNVVGFRVHYRDDEITSAQEDLAKEFGVGYQHTKVFIKNGERILKDPSSWSESKFISEITKHAG